MTFERLFDPSDPGNSVGGDPRGGREVEVRQHVQSPPTTGVHLGGDILALKRKPSVTTMLTASRRACYKAYLMAVEAGEEETAAQLKAALAQLEAIRPNKSSMRGMAAPLVSPCTYL